MLSSRVIHKSFHSMNSVLDIVLTDVDVELGEQACSEVYKQAEEFEMMLSCHNPDAEIYQLNEKALHGYVPVSTTVFNVLLECRQFHQLTKGYFDTGLKNFKSNSVANNDLHITFGFKAIEINDEKQAVKFWTDKTAIDLGGVGKGILLREADKILSRFNITNCFISFGGSSILTRGTHPHGNGWPVSLREGINSDFTFYLGNHAASFSESYQEGQNTAHIIHPKHLKPVDNRRLTFVQAYCPVISEVLSTSLIVAPVEEAGEIISSFQLEKAFIFNKTEQHNLSIEYQYGN